MTDRAIIDKIAKLLALAEGEGATPSEAANAAAAAQALMQRHKLDRATIEQEQSEGGEPIAAADDPLWTGGRYVSWVGDLADVLARLNGCRVLVIPAVRNGRVRRHARLHLVGRASDMQVVRYLFAYLRREIDRLAKKAVAEASVRQPRRWARNFRFGAVVAISRRLKEAKQRATERARDEQGHEATSQALVHLSGHEEALQRWLAEHSTRTYQEGRRAFDADGLAAGYRQGRAIPLHEGLHDGRPTPALNGGEP